MEEFIEIKDRIVRTRSGNMRTTEVLATSKNLSEEFLDMLWNDFGIDIEELELVDKEKLKAVDISKYNIDEVLDGLKIPEDEAGLIEFLAEDRRLHGRSKIE